MGNVVVERDIRRGLDGAGIHPGAEGDHGLDGEIGQGRRDAPQCLLLVLTSRAEGHENARPTIIAIPR